MADIRTVFIDMEHGADYAIQSMLLTSDDGLDTAVILSLFTDATALADDTVPGADRRGWWADMFADPSAGSGQAGDRIGSRLWLLVREKLTHETVNRVRAYCEEALAWLVRDGVAKEVTVTAEIIRHHPLGVIGAYIDITKPDGQITRYKFDKFWSAV